MEPSGGVSSEDFVALLCAQAHARREQTPLVIIAPGSCTVVPVNQWDGRAGGQQLPPELVERVCDDAQKQALTGFFLAVVSSTRVNVFWRAYEDPGAPIPLALTDAVSGPGAPPSIECVPVADAGTDDAAAKDAGGPAAGGSGPDDGASAPPDA